MEYAELLKKISFMKDLSTGELIKISSITEDIVCAEGDVICREGTHCEDLYIIRSGAVKIVKGGSHIETVSAGEPLGEMAFIDKGVRSATVLAGKDATLIKLPSQAFDQLLSRDIELANKIYRAIIKVLCKRLRDATETLKIIPEYVMDPIRNYDNI